MAIGFIGLGNIGKPMAKHLLKLSEDVWVYDVVQASVGELVSLGARGAVQPKQLAEKCRVIGLCVRDDNDVDSLLYGPDGLFENGQKDSIIAIHSTVMQASILRWAASGKAKGIHVIDAPITGGAAGAEAATLCYMVGGPKDIVERCRSIFSTSGQKIIHAGDTGAGIALKLCNNLMTYAAFTAVHEAASLAKAGGLSIDMLFEVGRSNGVVTPQMEAFIGNRARAASLGPEGFAKAFGPFGTLGKKDLTAALRSGEKLGLTLPATARIAELIEDVVLDRY